MSEPKEIWLQPWCVNCDNHIGEGRQWCEDNVWTKCSECPNKSVRYVIGERATDAEALLAGLREALDCRSLFINPEAMEKAADEIDCCGEPMRCDHAWHEWDTDASGCRQSEAGEYCPNDLAETLRALAKVARAFLAKAQP